MNGSILFYAVRACNKKKWYFFLYLNTLVQLIQKNRYFSLMFGLLKVKIYILMSFEFGNLWIFVRETASMYQQKQVENNKKMKQSFLPQLSVKYINKNKWYIIKNKERQH